MKAEELFDRAQKLIQNEDYDEALGVLMDCGSEAAASLGKLTSWNVYDGDLYTLKDSKKLIDTRFNV